jgi:hypothetical protein
MAKTVKELLARKVSAQLNPEIPNAKDMVREVPMSSYGTNLRTSPSSVPSASGKKGAFGAAAADDDSEDQVYVPKKTVKLDNSASTVRPNLPPPDNFRENIQKILTEEEEQKRVGFELTQKFFGLVKDKILDETKDTRYREYEKSTIRDLIDFARLINSDQNQEENIGTMSFVLALARAILMQRDRINQIDYDNQQLKKEIANANNRISKIMEQLQNR